MRERTKTVLKYGAGAAALAASLGAAWILPGWYASWQDSRREGQVELSSREEITFLDVDALDIAGVMKMLKGTSYYGYGYWDYYGEEMQQRAFQQLKSCEDNQLLPEGTLAALGLDEETGLPEEGSPSLLVSSPFTVYTSRGGMTVYLMRIQEVSGFGGGVTLVIDAEKPLTYYVSCNMELYWDGLAEELGYASFEEALEMEGREDSDDRELIFLALEKQAEKEAGFARMVGAESAEAAVDEEKGCYRVQLSFETFTGEAFGGFADQFEMGNVAGVSAMFGSELWQYFVRDAMEQYGYLEFPLEWSSSTNDFSEKRDGENYDLVETELETELPAQESYPKGGSFDKPLE